MFFSILIESLCPIPFPSIGNSIFLKGHCCFWEQGKRAKRQSKLLFDRRKWRAFAMLLRPDFTFYLKGIRVRRYDLTQHNPNAIPMPTAVMDRNSIVGITIHKPQTTALQHGNSGAVRLENDASRTKRCAGTLLCGRIRGVANAAVTARRLARYRWGRERQSPYHCH